MATFTVTNLLDSGLGSLRNAIFRANTASTTDTIRFNTSLSGGTIGLTSGELGISDDLTINGLGADLLSVDAGGNSRVFSVADEDYYNNLEVVINGLTITGGRGSLGGGIFNRETLTVSDSTISGNTSDSGLGGGIRNSGNRSGYGSYSNVTVTNSTISGNTGSGINGSYSNVTVTNSTVSGNTVDGISNYSGNVRVTNSTVFGNTDDGIVTTGRSGSSATVTNSTVSGNTDYGIISFASGYYGGSAFLTVSNSTISGNGIGVYSGDADSSTVTVTSSIIATNTDDQDIEGASFTSRGNNLIGNGDGAEGFTNGVNGDIVGTANNPLDPLLVELQDNGGPTLTQALLPGSLAIDAGSNRLDLEFDQRGPGFDRVVGAQTDIGAYEVPEPDSTLGLLLGLPLLGIVLFRKHRLKQKAKAMM